MTVTKRTLVWVNVSLLTLVLSLLVFAPVSPPPAYAQPPPVEATSLIGYDATTPGTSGGDVHERGGRCLTVDIGARNWGHRVFGHGMAASANAYQTSMDVQQYGDIRSGNPEGEWIVSDDGYLALPGFDPDAMGRERTPYLRRITAGSNPVTGRSAGLLLQSHAFMQLESLKSYIQFSLPRGQFVSRAWASANPTSPGAGDGSGGAVHEHNRFVTTTGATTELLFAAQPGLVVTGKLALFEATILADEPGGLREVFRFAIRLVGGVGWVGTPSEPVTSPTLYVGLAGRVALGTTGVQPSVLPTLSVTGRPNVSIRWTGVFTLTRGI